jgi:hypothetical protein
MWDDENERQYKAFECYLSIDPRVRTIENAWTKYIEITPDASGAQPSSSFKQWSRKFKWAERARAADADLAKKRRGAYEKGVVKEAQRQGVNVERLRDNLQENFFTIQNTLEAMMTTLAQGDSIDPDKITLAGLSNLMRVQLDLAKYLSDDSNGKTPVEELDKMSEEQLAEELYKRAAGGGEEEGTS